MIKGKFLLPYYNPHAYPILDSLNEIEGVDLIIGLYYPTALLRPGYEWPEPASSHYLCLWKDNKQRQEFLSNVEDYDFFGSLGIFQNLDFFRFASKCTRTNKPFFLMSEGLKYKGALNKLIRKVAVARMNRPNVHLLSIGKGCVEDYRSIGASKWKVLQFSFTSNAPITAPGKRHSGAPLKVVFVGQLIERKNLKVLMDAMAMLKEEKIELSVVGDGPYMSMLRKLVKAYNLSNTSLVGQMPQEEVFAVMQKSDVLVLPSFYDGWGAVVNEAMCLSSVVVVSSGVRASIAVSDGVNGYVFEPDDHKKLAGILRNLSVSAALVEKIKMHNYSTAHRFTKEYLAQIIVNELPVTLGLE